MYSNLSITSRASHLIVLHVATDGLQGDCLGTDQAEIIWLSYTIIDVRANKEVGRRQYIVKPGCLREGDDRKDNDDRSPKSSISNDTLERFSTLTHKLIQEKGVSLEEALTDVDNWLYGQSLPRYESLIVSNGHAPISQCLQPEACKKFIKLHWEHYSFFDLRKEFSICYSSEQQKLQVSGIEQMMQHINLPGNAQLYNSFTKEAADMVSLVHRMIADGHVFDYRRNAEYLFAALSPRLRNSDPFAQVTDDHVVLIRGLSWPFYDWEVYRFFKGLTIIPGGVVIRLSAQGRRSGEALVCFKNKQQRDMALKRHRHFFDQMRVEVHEASAREFLAVANQIIIDVTKIPTDWTATQVVQFFASGDEPSVVVDGEEGVLFVKGALPWHQALVLFADEKEAERALGKDTKYWVDKDAIQLKRLNTDSAQRVLNDSCCVEFDDRYRLPIVIDSSPALYRNKWVHLNNLPRGITVKDIVKVLGLFISSDIVKNGIHLVVSNGESNGEAFIEMKNERYCSSVDNHFRYDKKDFDGKRHWIKTVQCNGLGMKTRFFQGEIDLEIPPPTPNNKIPNKLRNKWVHLYNLPHKTTVEDILKFLGHYIYKNIVRGGIHLVRKITNETSGEAFIETTHEDWAAECATLCRSTRMKYSGKFYKIVAQPCNSQAMNSRSLEEQFSNNCMIGA